MLPLFLKKNTKSYEQSFYIERFTIPHTYDVWHNHSELEFLHILKGRGTRFIGDSIESFHDKDMVLVGSNLPHVWRSDKIYYDNDPDLKIELILTQFLSDFAGKDFFNLPEMKQLKELFEDAALGIQILGETRDLVSTKLLELTHIKGADKLLEFLLILNIIAKTKEYKILSSLGFIDSYQSKGAKRINKVHDFIMNNFTEDISLQQAAEIAIMNESAFCRYFKSTTLKTFTQFLNEVRIGYACKLLLHQSHNISSAGYESGFKNISYFNRVFKNALGITPKQYQQKYGQ